MERILGKWKPLLLHIGDIKSPPNLPFALVKPVKNQAQVSHANTWSELLLAKTEISF